MYIIVQIVIIKILNFKMHNQVNQRSRIIYFKNWVRVLHFLVFVSFMNLNLFNENTNVIAFLIYILTKSSFLNAMLTLSKTTSPHNLFRSDCIKLFQALQQCIPPPSSTNASEEVKIEETKPEPEEDSLQKG